MFAFKISYDKLLNRLGNSKGLFNGNISETFWKTSTDNYERQYGYEYDALNRLTKANFYNHGNSGEETMFNETLMYDPNGNIMNLERMGKIQSDSHPIDQLIYAYDGNQLKEVRDDSNSPQGFNDGNTSGDDYGYDGNGNMLFDLNKGIELIKYNHLNLPTQINFVNGNNIDYFYNAVGQKVKKKVKSGSEYADTDYLSGFQYRSSYTEAQGNQSQATLQYFPHAEGYVQHVEGKFFYVYNYTDHLGNIRLGYTYDENTGLIKIMEENHYYPFGLKHDSYNTNRLGYSSYIDEEEISHIVLGDMPKFVGDGSYNYKYNGKELQDELGLNWYDYGARNYDPALGRWMNVDPLAEKSRRWSTYTYCYDNPLVFVDYDGMYATPPIDFYNTDGRKIGTDGNSTDNRKVVVTDDAEVKQIKKTDKGRGTTALSDVSSAVVLPSDVALSESLDVLKRTEAKTDKDPVGGLHGESSLVLKDGTVVKGESGNKAYIDSNNILTADETLPSLPKGKTTSDIEVTIHSHLTGTILQNDQIYSHDARLPSAQDTKTFGANIINGPNTNIIVGPLGNASAQTQLDGSVRVSQPGNGISIFNGRSTTPSISLSKKAVERILETN